MSVITFQCFACNQVLQVGADNAGRKAKCSQCGAILTIPTLTAERLVEGAAPLSAAPKPPPALGPRGGAADDAEVRDDVPPRRHGDYDDDRPRRRRADEYDGYNARRPATPNWDKVNIGILLVFLGTIIGFFSITGWRILAQIGLTILLFGTIAAGVGHVFCLFVFSNKRGAMGFAIAALAVGGIYFLFQIVGLARIFGAFWSISAVPALLTGVLRAAHFMMIAFFVRSLSQMFDQRRLESSAMLNVILSSCLAGFDLVAGIILVAMAPNIFDAGQGYWMVSSILNLLGGALTIVVYIFTILAVYHGKRMLDYGASVGAPRHEPRDDGW